MLRVLFFQPDHNTLLSDVCGKGRKNIIKYLFVVSTVQSSDEKKRKKTITNFTTNSCHFCHKRHRQNVAFWTVKRLSHFLTKFCTFAAKKYNNAVLLNSAYRWWCIEEFIKFFLGILSWCIRTHHTHAHTLCYKFFNEWIMRWNKVEIVITLALCAKCVPSIATESN